MNHVQKETVDHLQIDSVNVVDAELQYCVDKICYQNVLQTSILIGKYGLTTPQLNQESLLANPIWPEEITSLQEIMRVPLSFDFNSLNHLTSTQMLSLSLGKDGFPSEIKNLNEISIALPLLEINNLGISTSLRYLLDNIVNEFPCVSKQWSLMQLNWILWTLVCHMRRSRSMPNENCSIDSSF